MGLETHQKRELVCQRGKVNNVIGFNWLAVFVKPFICVFMCFFMSIFMGVFLMRFTCSALHNFGNCLGFNVLLAMCFLLNALCHCVLWENVVHPFNSVLRYIHIFNVLQCTVKWQDNFFKGTTNERNKYILA